MNTIKKEQERMNHLFVDNTTLYEIASGLLRIPRKARNDRLKKKAPFSVSLFFSTQCFH